MRKYQSLTKAKDFLATRRMGKSWSNGLLVLMARSNGLNVARLGYSVGKRTGNAVVRNKLKRRLREAMRLEQVQEGWDLVLIARRDASLVDFHRLRDSVTNLLARADVLGPRRQHLKA